MIIVYISKDYAANLSFGKFDIFILCKLKKNTL